MTIISTHELALFKAGAARAQSINMLHQAGHEDAKQLQRLVGQTCKRAGKTYRITAVQYDYGGFITARGYRELDNGKVSELSSHLGALTAEMFEDV